MDGTEAGTMKLSDKVFGVEYNEPLIHQAVVTRLANERREAFVFEHARGRAVCTH